MSGPARTAEVTVQVTYRITDTATEGEMIDGLHRVIRNTGVALDSEAGSVAITGVESHIKTISTGGHL